MKIKDYLKNSFIICNNKEDWEKVQLILSSHIRPIAFPLDTNSEYQYINIGPGLELGWDTSIVNNIKTYTKGLKQISLDVLFMEF